MKCPKCNKDGFKKVFNEDGTHYYRCSSCAYETQIISLITKLWRKFNEKTNSN